MKDLVKGTVTKVNGPSIKLRFENESDQYRRVLINGYAHPGANRFAYPGSGTGQRLVAPPLN